MQNHLPHVCGAYIYGAVHHVLCLYAAMPQAMPHLEVCTEFFGLERGWRVSAPSMTSPPDARRSLSRRPVGPVSTAGMEAVARMASFAKREKSDLAACITAEISDSAECKVSWWRSNYSVGIGLWQFWGVNKLERDSWAGE